MQETEIHAPPSAVLQNGSGHADALRAADAQRLDETAPGVYAVRPPNRALRRVRREAWYDISEEAYPGYQVKLWINYPHWYRAEIQSGDNDRMQAVLSQVVLEHNGWPDESSADESAVLPQPNEIVNEGRRGFWDLISDELAGLILTCVLMEPQELSFLAVRKRNSSRSG